MKKNAELFPYVLVRISAGSAQEFTKLSHKHTPAILKRLADLQNDIDQVRETLSQDFYTLIANCEKVDERKSLLRLRRDIYNERLDTLLEADKKLLPAIELSKTKAYVKLRNQKSLLLKDGEASFDKESRRSKKLFRKLLQKPDLQNGILLSSTSLSSSLKTYILEPQRQLPKVERSLMRYLSRMYTKPTPFSTFTTLAIGTFAEKHLPASANKKSHVELNHYIFHYLVGLLVQNKAVRQHLHLRLNPTIRFDDGQVIFICNNFDRESMQRIRVTPAMQLVYDIMQANESLTYNELIEQLSAKQSQNVTSETIGRYMDTLLSYGFIEFDFGIMATDSDWNRKFIVFLKRLPEYPYLVDLQKTLRYLRKAKDKYEVASPRARAKLLQDAFTKFRQTCLQLHVAAGLPEKELASFSGEVGRSRSQARPKNEDVFTLQYDTVFKFQHGDIWYEDAYLDTQLTLPAEAAESFELLGDLLSWLGWLDDCSEPLYEITDFFKQYYQESERVDLLQFYEAYYREKRGGEKDSKRIKHAMGPALNTFKKRKAQYLDEFIRNVKGRINGEPVLHVTQRDVAHMERLGGSSFAAYFQLARTNLGKQQLVMNSTAPGYGKMIGRFLPLFGQGVTDTFRDWNEKSAGVYAALFAESTDASAFNANIHPSLMPYATTASGSYTSLPPERQISVTDIEIAYQKHSDHVRLFHKNDGKEIFSFDLAFQSITERAKLYEFLSNFTPSPHRHPEPLLKHINSEVRGRERKGSVVVLPRVVYEQAIVLQRRTWEVPKNQLALRLPSQGDWDYFRQIDSWRRELGLPDKVFVRIGSEKPQYIDFANPLLIHLLEKIFEKMSKAETLLIEEMLPNTEQQPGFHGNQAVTEFLAHWYD